MPRTPAQRLDLFTTLARETHEVFGQLRIHDTQILSMIRLAIRIGDYEVGLVRQDIIAAAVKDSGRKLSLATPATPPSHEVISQAQAQEDYLCKLFKRLFISEDSKALVVACERHYAIAWHGSFLPIFEMELQGIYQDQRLGRGEKGITKALEAAFVLYHPHFAKEGVEHREPDKTRKNYTYAFGRFTKLRNRGRL